MIGLEERKIPLQGVRNARELKGIPVAGGRQVKGGLLIRCGRLADMTKEDRILLEEIYQVSEIIDLRNPQETIEHPDQPIGQALWEGIALLPGMAQGISKEDGDRPDPIDEQIRMVRSWDIDPMDGMRGMYQMLASNDYCLDKTKEFLHAWLGHKEGAFLWHCTAGKDRTGITAALMLWLLGADRRDIEQEYAETDVLLKEYLDNFEATILERSGDSELAKKCRVLETVHPSYLKAYFAVLEETYGSIDRFLEERMEITKEQRNALVEKYTE